MLRRFSFSPSLICQEKRLAVGASASSSLRKRKYSACVSGRGVAPSPEPRSVHRLGTWLRIFLLFFFPSRRLLGTWTEAEFGKKGRKVCIGAGFYLHIAGRRESKGEGLVQSRDHGIQMCSKPAGVTTLPRPDGGQSSERQRVPVLAAGVA